MSDIALFALVAKFNNMGAAAQELGVTPPMVSRRIAALEKRLNVRLLNRTTRRIALTPEGEHYLQEGVRITEQLAALEHRLGGTSVQPQGVLRVCATLGFGRKHIAPIVLQFVRQHPNVEVQLHLTDRPMNLVKDGFDVLIRFGDPNDSQLTARLLANNRRIVCASPSYLKRAGLPSTPRELGRHNCIFVRQGDETFGTWQFRRGDDHCSVKVHANLSSNDGAAALTWALAGEGVFLRSQWEVAEHIRSGRLVPILNDWQTSSANIYALFLASTPLPAKIRGMVDLLLVSFEKQRARVADEGREW